MMLLSTRSTRTDTLFPDMTLLRSDMENESLYTWSTARDLGGVTGCVYVVVPDPDAHCLHARNAGAVVVQEPQDNEGYPGRGYTALDPERSEEHTSELQSLMRISYAVFCLQTKTKTQNEKV